MNALAIERVQNNSESIEDTFKRGRVMGVPDCCITHFVAHFLVSRQAAAERYGVLVPELPRWLAKLLGKPSWSPCDFHRDNPPEGYRWDSRYVTGNFN